MTRVKIENTERVQRNTFNFQHVNVVNLQAVALYSTSRASLVLNVYTCHICTRLHSVVYLEHVLFSPLDTCMAWIHRLITLPYAYSTPAVLQTKCNTLIAGAWPVPPVYSVCRA